MTPAQVLRAIRELVAAAEEAGWDVTENAAILNNGRDAYAALQTVMADADDEQEPYDAN